MANWFQYKELFDEGGGVIYSLLGKGAGAEAGPKIGLVDWGECERAGASGSSTGVEFNGQGKGWRQLPIFKCLGCLGLSYLLNNV